MTLKASAQPKLEKNGLVPNIYKKLPVTSSLWSHRKKGLSKKIETSEREQFFGPPSVAVSTGFPENPEFDFNQPAPVLSDSIRFATWHVKKIIFFFLGLFVPPPCPSHPPSQVSVSFLLFFGHRAGTGLKFLGLQAVPGILLRASLG